MMMMTSIDHYYFDRMHRFEEIDSIRSAANLNDPCRLSRTACKDEEWHRSIIFTACECGAWNLGREKIQKPIAKSSLNRRRRTRKTRESDNLMKDSSTHMKQAPKQKTG